MIRRRLCFGSTIGGGTVGTSPCTNFLKSLPAGATHCCNHLSYIRSRPERPPQISHTRVNRKQIITDVYNAQGLSAIAHIRHVALTMPAHPQSL
jgi:uncharacterized ferritin-like protein (DUF455 family)